MRCQYPIRYRIRYCMLYRILYRIRCKKTWLIQFNWAHHLGQCQVTTSRSKKGRFKGRILIRSPVMCLSTLSSWFFTYISKKWASLMQFFKTIIRSVFTIMYIIFLADQDCSCCKYVLRPADLCTPILYVITSIGDIRETAVAVWSAQTVLLFCYYCALYLF